MKIYKYFAVDRHHIQNNRARKSNYGSLEYSSDLKTKNLFLICSEIAFPYETQRVEKAHFLHNFFWA